MEIDCNLGRHIYAGFDAASMDNNDSKGPTEQTVV